MSQNPRSTRHTPQEDDPTKNEVQELRRSLRRARLEIKDLKQRLQAVNKRHKASEEQRDYIAWLEGQVDEATTEAMEATLRAEKTPERIANITKPAAAKAARRVQLKPAATKAARRVGLKKVGEVGTAVANPLFQTDSPLPGRKKQKKKKDGLLTEATLLEKLLAKYDDGSAVPMIPLHND